jgi:hypothetical protein
VDAASSSIVHLPQAVKAKANLDVHDAFLMQMTFGLETRSGTKVPLLLEMVDCVKTISFLIGLRRVLHELSLDASRTIEKDPNVVCNRVCVGDLVRHCVDIAPDGPIEEGAVQAPG